MKMSDEEKQKEALAQLKSALRRTLDENAYERMINVLMVNQNLFANAAQRILAAYQRLGRTITERDVLMILRTLKDEPQRGGITIKRK